MENTYTNQPPRFAALARALNRPGIGILRYGLVIVLLWIGAMKFTSYEAAGIAPLEMHSPLMNWLYVLMGQRNISDLLGVVEIALGIGIALRYVYPHVSGMGTHSGFPRNLRHAWPVPVEGCRAARRSELHRQ